MRRIAGKWRDERTAASASNSRKTRTMGRTGPKKWPDLNSSSNTNRREQNAGIDPQRRESEQTSFKNATKNPGNREKNLRAPSCGVSPIPGARFCPCHIPQSKAKPHRRLQSRVFKNRRPSKMKIASRENLGRRVSPMRGATRKPKSSIAFSAI